MKQSQKSKNEQTIEIDMSMGMHYKNIFKDCKDRIERFTEITYLTSQS